MLVVMPLPAHADPYAAGMFMQLSNSTLESCIRTIVATRSGRGTWGGHNEQVDANGTAYVDGQMFGRARSSQEEGTASPFNRMEGQERRNWDYYRYHQPH
jgi:hypothetical protein